MDMLLNQQIQQLYELQHEVTTHDRQIFTLSLAEIQGKSITYKKQWVENTRHTIYKCIEDYQEQQKRGQKDIRSYFQPVTNTNG